MQAHITPMITFLKEENAALDRYIHAIGLLGRLVTHKAGTSVRRWELISDYAANQAAKVQTLHNARVNALTQIKLTHDQARLEDQDYRAIDDIRRELLFRAKSETESQRTLIDVIARDLKERSAAIMTATRPLDVYTRKDVRAPYKQRLAHSTL